MTMPNSVWINNGDNQQTWLHSCNKNHTQRMILADIAEELARAGRYLLNATTDDAMCDAEDKLLSALVRYRETTSDVTIIASDDTFTANYGGEKCR